MQFLQHQSSGSVDDHRTATAREAGADINSLMQAPVQRIGKYPAVLQGLHSLAQQGRRGASRRRAPVAAHVNEMQQIRQDFGATFDELAELFHQVYPHKLPVDLSIGELRMFGTVEWLNSAESLGGSQADQQQQQQQQHPQLCTSCFVFRHAVVLLCQEPRPTDEAANTVGNYDLIRFQTVIPATDVQVRCGLSNDTQRSYLWDLVHLASIEDNRVEKLYQLANSSAEARDDFLKTIRHAVRDAARVATEQHQQQHQAPQMRHQ
uniref:DH domain-containing protein n=1 Tax=Macrostomum lignano TaxID=282301 RepID=A0A1I8HXL3_9PLAT